VSWENLICIGSLLSNSHVLKLQVEPRKNSRDLFMHCIAKGDVCNSEVVKAV
jgi:hypothetical protein